MNPAELSEAWSFLVRIAVSAALGGLLGLERDIHGRGAGLRTHLLVSVGSAVFMILSIRVESFGVGLDPGFMRVTDPGRIAAQIVTGIGFLGAGVIIKVGLSVRGLTTAAVTKPGISMVIGLIPAALTAVISLSPASRP